MKYSLWGSPPIYISIRNLFLIVLALCFMLGTWQLFFSNTVCFVLLEVIRLCSAVVDRMALLWLVTAWISYTCPDYSSHLEWMSVLVSWVGWILMIYYRVYKERLLCLIPCFPIAFLYWLLLVVQFLDVPFDKLPVFF